MEREFFQYSNSFSMKSLAGAIKYASRKMIEVDLLFDSALWPFDVGDSLVS